MGLRSGPRARGVFVFGMTERPFELALLHGMGCHEEGKVTLHNQSSTRMLIMAVIAGSGLDGDNPAITVGENVIAVNLAPFVALGRTTQVILAVVQFIPAIPVFLLDLGALLPLIVVAICAIVVAILRLRLIVPILVWMVLREGGQAGKGYTQDGKSKRFDHSVHRYSRYSWKLRFPSQCCCCPEAIIRNRAYCTFTRSGEAPIRGPIMDVRLRSGPRA